MMADERLTKLGASIADLDQASQERLEDAEVLLRGGRYAAAITHAIYALEIKLKVLICRRLDTPKLYRVFEIHDLQVLMLYTGLDAKLRNLRRPRYVAKNWNELLELSKKMDQIRYKPDPNQWNQQLAEMVLHWLRDPPHGVLPWLSKQASRKTP
jgi:HEPN domain-containing protein